MTRLPFTVTSLGLGGLLMVISLFASGSLADLLLAFMMVGGPNIVFSLAVAAVAIVKYRRWESLLLLILGQAIYHTGGGLLDYEYLLEEMVSGSGGLWPPIISLLTGMTYLIAARLLFLRGAPWSVLLKWGPVCFVAGLPFLTPIHRLGEGVLGSFWWWGLHVLLWFVCVGHALDRMAGAAFPRPAPRVAVLLALALVPAGGWTATVAEEGRPLLVTVDDLPMSGGDRHGDPHERRRITEAMLAALDKHDITAVGMVTWGNVRFPGDDTLLAMWLEAGHELGNHSYRHRSAAALTADEFIEDAERARVEIASLLQAHGRSLRFFRFPMLREGDTLEKLRAIRAYLDRTAQSNLPVTLDNQDWSFDRPWVEAKRRGDEAALRRIAREYHEAMHVAVAHHERLGDRLYGRPLPQILLLHAGAVGAAQWDELFTWLEETGHRFAMADEVLSDPVFDDPVEYVGTHGPGLWERVADVRRKEAAETSVRETIRTQVAAWNRGDLETFCSVYAEDAAFVAPSGLTRGRAEVLERYRRRYPDRAAMGTLEIGIQEVRLASGTEVSMLGDARPGRVHEATVVARWTLRYEGKDPATGLTLIVMRPRGDGWEIIQDASM